MNRSKWQEQQNRALYLDGKNDRTPEEEAELRELAGPLEDITGSRDLRCTAALRGQEIAKLSRRIHKQREALADQRAIIIGHLAEGMLHKQTIIELQRKIATLEDQNGKLLGGELKGEGAVAMAMMSLEYKLKDALDILNSAKKDKH